MNTQQEQKLEEAIKALSELGIPASEGAIRNKPDYVIERAKAAILLSEGAK